MVKLVRYEYPLKTKKETYNGSYTLKYGTKPLGFKGERIVQIFTANVK